jgi:hypothetical protein
MRTREPLLPAGSLLAGGAEALWSEGDLRESRGWFDAAYLVAEHLGDGRSMAEAALGLGGLRGGHQPSAMIARDRLRRALAAVPSDEPLAFRLRTRPAAEEDNRVGGHARILACLDQARDLADPVAVAEELSLAHQCLLGPQHGSVRRVLAHELIAESSRTRRRGDLLVGHLLLAGDRLSEADPSAGRTLSALRDMLDEKDNRAIRFVLSALDVMMLIRAGRLEEAESAATHCARYGEAVGDAGAATWLAAHTGAIRWFQGRVGEVLPMVRDLALPAAEPVGPFLPGCGGGGRSRSRSVPGGAGRDGGVPGRPGRDPVLW